MLIEKNIVPVIKDRSESARLAGFGSVHPHIQEVYVHNDEKTLAKELIRTII